MSVNHKPLLWGSQEWFPLNGGAGMFHGVQTAFAWVADVMDLQEANNASLHLVAPAGATYAQVVIPSTTSGCGLLFSANSPGSSSVTVIINAPTGSTSAVTVATAAITVAPALGATNGSIMALINNNAAASALVTVDLWGAQSNGDPWSSLQEDPMDISRNDLVVATTSTAMAGGGTAAPIGNINILCSNLPDVSSMVPSGYTLAVSGTGSYNVNMPAIGFRYIQVQWVPSGTPSGLLYGAIMGKGTHS